MASNARASTAPTAQGYSYNPAEGPLTALKKLLLEVDQQKEDEVIVQRHDLVAALEAAQELIELGAKVQVQRDKFRTGGVMPALMSALTTYWTRVGSKVFRQPMSAAGLQAMATEAVAQTIAYLPPSMAQPPTVQLQVAMIEILQRLSSMA